MKSADPYQSLGVRPRINAAGALTRLGGAVMAPEVVAAMAAASRASVDIGELQDAASGRIAQATGAEAGAGAARPGAVCRANGIPMIVDAAAQLPPKENLKRFIAMGADLVAFSGGKALGGPQASGILAGRRDLVASALLQQLDMDVSPETWTPPRMVDRANLRGVPHHGIGRGFKAGKEEIVGLLMALARFENADDAADNEALAARLTLIAALLEGIADITVTLVPAAKTGRVPVLEITVPDALALSACLQRGDPPVHLSERHAARGVLTLDPQVLLPEHDAPLAAAIRAQFNGRT